MNNVKQSQIEAFLKVMDPEDNATGGGAASAVAGAMAAGLAGMVARVSMGKPGMESDEFYAAIDAEARGLVPDLMAGAEADSTAFEGVMAAYKMPKESVDEKAARSEAIQDGMESATDVPLRNGELCVRVLGLIDRLAPRHNLNAASDLDVGRRLAQAALQGCIANVEINLDSLKREAARSEFATRLSDLRRVAASVAGGVHV